MRRGKHEDIVRNDNGSARDREQRGEEICRKIRDVLEGKEKIEAIRRPGALSPKLERLAALASVLATQQDLHLVTTAVNACLEVQATPREIMQVLEQTILMAEIPALAYRAAVRKAVEAFQRR